jgi:succinate-semialdehyde dehydrogenase / glutarate-semialdehyde dehydrogenase
MSADLPVGVPNQMLIGGKWLDSDGGTFDVLNPATGAVLTTVPAGRIPDMKAAVDAAAAALPAWRETAPRVRSELLRATWQIMQDNRENLARLMTLEMGKTLTDANGEVTYSSEFFRWFAEEAVRIGGELRTAPSGANKILTFRQPIGVALLVTPWNFPAAMATRKIAPALAAGCTVVVKPAGETPLTTLYIASLMEQVGLPAGVVNVVTSDRAGEVVDAALEDDRVRKISFTGSTGVGRILLKKAADRVIASSMELGGNDPFLVLADADVDAAVEGAMIAKMRNGGQACTAANRFLVHRDIADEFATKLAARMGGLKMGPGLDEGVELGPMVSEKAVTGIADLVDRSVAAGATAVLGGTRPDGPGFFYPATVLTNVPADAPVSTQEIFGPVAPVIAVDSDEEALALANATEFGLVGYIYSRDLAHGLRVSEQLDVGMVGLNRGLVSDPAAPFGGVKESGLGREGGFEGIDEYLETKYVAASW